MQDEYICEGWACTDCLMELANGEGNPELSEQEQAGRDRDIAERNADYRITLGMLRELHACATNYTITLTGGTEHEVRADDAADARENFDYRTEYYGAPAVATVTAHDLETEAGRDSECDCEEQSFSWAQCDVCGSSLGGTRHAVSFWKITA